MAHPLKHAESSAKKFGGKSADYLTIHNWFDESKALFADFPHRALRHHAEGVFLAERIFGISITNHDGVEVPVRYIAEQHINEDLGGIPRAKTGWQRSGRNIGCTGNRGNRLPGNTDSL